MNKRRQQEEVSALNRCYAVLLLHSKRKQPSASSPSKSPRTFCLTFKMALEGVRRQEEMRSEEQPCMQPVTREKGGGDSHLSLSCKAPTSCGGSVCTGELHVHVMNVSDNRKTRAWIF